jgi:hypothetical protein
MKKFLTVSSCLLLFSLFALSQDNNNKVNDDYFSLGLGYGNSYGGFGLKLQYVTPGQIRAGIHGGGGYFPWIGGMLHASGGLQLYPWKNLYLDAQFGMFGVYRFIMSNGSTTTTTKKALYGPGLLLGYDFFFNGKYGLNIAAGASYNIHDISLYEGDSASRKIYPRIDLGFVIKL